jgi:NADH-quinone oxidoreductase subunit J
MEFITANNIIFALLSVIVLGCGLLSVLTEKLMHAAFYLFLTLVGVAGLYLQMSYDFLAAAQLSVYAGGILMLFIFAIVLVHRIGENSEHVRMGKKARAGFAALCGIAVVLCTMFLFGNFSEDPSTDQFTETVNMELIGRTLLGTGKHQYLLPFEATGILLLACIIGALVIANKEKEDKE